VTRKLGFRSKGEADRELWESEQAEKSRKRKVRAKRNQLFNQATLKSLPQATLNRIRKALSNPRSNMKRIARENGLSHSFIVWLWRHDDDRTNGNE